jgi:hypothetical protein
MYGTTKQYQVQMGAVEDNTDDARYTKVGSRCNICIPDGRQVVLSQVGKYRGTVMTGKRDQEGIRHGQYISTMHADRCHDSFCVLVWSSVYDEHVPKYTHPGKTGKQNLKDGRRQHSVEPCSPARGGGAKKKKHLEMKGCRCPIVCITSRQDGLCTLAAVRNRP